MIRPLSASLLRPHRRVIAAALGLLTMQSAAAMAIPSLIAVGIDRGIPALRHGDRLPVLTICGLAIICALADALLRRWFVRRAGWIGQDILFSLRQRVFRRVVELPVAYHNATPSGQTIARLTADVNAVSGVITAGLEGLLPSILTAAAIAVVLPIMDWQLATVVFVGLVPLVPFVLWFRRRSSVAYRASRAANAALTCDFAEAMIGIRALQAYRREELSQAAFRRRNHDYRAANQKTSTLLAVFAPGIRLLGNLTVAVTLLVGGMRILEGGMQVGVLVAFLLYQRRFFEPVQDWAMFFNSYQAASAALERLAAVLEEPSTVPEPATPVPLRRSMVRGEVTMHKVTFAYPGGRLVLDKFSLRLRAGETVALVGPSGAGKTTIARLVTRFHDPQCGEVTLDGVDLRDIADRLLRGFVVTVPQEAVLFSGTVADNIAFGRPGVCREEIERVAHVLGAHEFIAALPDGYSSDVGKAGARLSTGQRQLIAFARALVADPAVLVLDEPTAALDLPSERRVHEAMRKLVEGRTALVIAHREATIEMADRVVQIANGQIFHLSPVAGPANNTSSDLL